MFAFLSQKVAVSEASQYTSISWNKENDMFVAGRSDGKAVVRKMDSETKSRATPKAEDGMKTDEQDLVNHQVSVKNIAWNPRHEAIATGDTDGITTVWKLDNKTGLWTNYMATRAVQRSVVGMQWTAEGDRICIVYETGTAMVGKIDGVKMWSVELKHAKIPAWSADGEIVLIGTTLGQIFIYDKAANNVGLVSLTSKPDEKPSESPLVDLKWYVPSNGVTSYNPTLAVAFEDGRCYLLQSEEDKHPIMFQVPMTIACLDWSANGKSIAIAGRSRKTVVAPEESAQLMIYTQYGKQEYSMRFKNKFLSALCWDSTGQRIAVILDGALNFVVIKRPIKTGLQLFFFSGMKKTVAFASELVQPNDRPAEQKLFCVFENTLAYSCAKDDADDALLVMYNLKTEKRVTVKHYTNQRVLCLAAGNDYCAAATRVTSDANQFNVYILSDTGATINVSFTSIEPVYAAASESQIFLASREVVYVWSFRQTGLASENSSGRWSTNERYFHIDDAHGFLDLKQKRQRLYEVSADPICAMTASRETLIIGRESGALVRYSLPQMMWEREYPSVLPIPRKLGLNKNSSRLLIMNYEGRAAIYALEEIKLSKDATPVKDVKIMLERRDIWDFMWAEDDPEMFIVSHKGRAIVHRNLEAEEPVANEGYFCNFKDLEIRVGQLDELIRSATPTDPPVGCVKTIRVKALRETHHLMETVSLTEAQRFVEMHPHKVLWNLLANKAVQRLELELAEMCFVRGENYAGIQLVHKLQKLKSDRLRKAEVAAYYGDHYRAEQEYSDANRADLAADLRRISGDWFRLKEMALDSQEDNLAKEASIGMGNYHYDRQSWSEAVRNYEAARDYASLYKCYMVTADTVKLEELAFMLPNGHPLLIEIGNLLGRYGDSVAAARILVNAGRADLAVQVCLACYNFQMATELSRTHELGNDTPETVANLMDKAIKEQIISQGDSNSLWNAANLYYNSSCFLESAKCLFQILEAEASNKATDYLRLKKIGVLAASAVEEFRKSTERRSGQRKLSLLEESKSVEFPFMDHPWHAAEAYNLMLVAQSYYAAGDFKRALRAAGTMCVYTDVLDAVAVFSMIALSASCMKRWDVVNEAILRIRNVEDVNPETVNEMEQFADELFAKFSPKDVDADEPLPSPECVNCKARIALWGIHCQNCGTQHPICMATGSPVAEGEVWQCDFCHRHCAPSAVLNRNVCPLCHRPRS